MTVTISQALREFFYFLEDKPTLLIGHNIKVFDCPVLINAARACDLLERLKMVVAGCVDTLPLFRATFNDLSSHKQCKLYEHLFDSTYDAHDALADVKALQKIVGKAQHGKEVFETHSFTLDYIIKNEQISSLAKKNLEGWQPLIIKSVISKGMAEKAAKSGLRPEHLKLAFKRGGSDGVCAILSERTSSRKVRVTNCQRVLDKIVQHFINSNG